MVSVHNDIIRKTRPMPPARVTSMFRFTCISPVAAYAGCHRGALWGSVKARRLLPATVIVSDDAGQFKASPHALCWVHAEHPQWTRFSYNAVIYKDFSGDPGRNRTCDLQLRRLLLYPLSYGAMVNVPTLHARPARSDFRVRFGTFGRTITRKEPRQHQRNPAGLRKCPPTRPSGLCRSSGQS